MTTYYEKRGRRYYPIAERDAFYAIPEGDWLVHVRPGLRSSKKLIEPAYPELEAAMRVAEEAMVKAMYGSSTERLEDKRYCPADRELARKGWEAWKAVVGDRPIYCTSDSMLEVVRAGIRAVREHCKKQPDRVILP